MRAVPDPMKEMSNRMTSVTFSMFHEALNISPSAALAL